jgi:Uma2 family endonuclease
MPAQLRYTSPLPPGAPTMYDLPSEDPEEPGLPDDFHYLQPALLRETFMPTAYPPEQTYIGSDINLYYDLDHPLWHKRPDWFLVLGARPVRSVEELRLSYVIWQEQAAPYLVVELLSPGTEKEDLGESRRDPHEPPGKWEVYERILKVPFYAVYSRYTGRLRVFTLAQDGCYRQLALFKKRLWLPEIGLHLGVWHGEFNGVEGKWLCWLDAAGNPLPTRAQREAQEWQRAEEEKQRAEQEQQRADQEQQRADQEQQRADQEQQRAEQEKQRADKLAARLRELGIDPG